MCVCQCVCSDLFLCAILFSSMVGLELQSVCQCLCSPHFSASACLYVRRVYVCTNCVRVHCVCLFEMGWFSLYVALTARPAQCAHNFHFLTYRRTTTHRRYSRRSLSVVVVVVVVVAVDVVAWRIDSGINENCPTAARSGAHYPICPTPIECAPTHFAHVNGRVQNQVCVSCMCNRMAEYNSRFAKQ